MTMTNNRLPATAPVGLQTVWTLAVLFLVLVNSAARAVLSPLQVQQVLDTFNQARATTLLPAANMNMLVWDANIAAQMDAFLLGCDIYAPTKGFLGDPPSYVFYLDAQTNPVWVAYWRTVREAPLIDPNTYQCLNNTHTRFPCDHPEIYKMGIVAQVERVGCGFNICGPSPLQHIHACAFAKGSFNPNPNVPFIEGPRCSQCPADKPFCDHGLCSAIKPTDSPTLFPTTAKPTRYPTSYPTRRPKKSG